ncbi:hypothetical protein LEZ92_28645, partial [Escherichia coli]|nr:hypothetical protein [Escherichia coli]
RRSPGSCNITVKSVFCRFHSTLSISNSITVDSSYLTAQGTPRLPYSICNGVVHLSFCGRITILNTI